MRQPSLDDDGWVYPRRLAASLGIAMLAVLASTAALLLRDAGTPIALTTWCVVACLALMAGLLAVSLARRGPWAESRVLGFAALSIVAAALSAGFSGAACLVAVVVSMLHGPRRTQVAVVGSVILAAAVIDYTNLEGIEAVLWWAFFVGGVGFVAAAGWLVARLRDSVAAEIDLAASRERTRIIAELHDSLGHSLTVAHMHLQGAEAVLKDDRRLAETSARTARIAIEDGLREMDAAGSVVSGADHVALGQRLTQLVEVSNSPFQRVRQTITGPARAVPRHVGVALLRMAQEALTNARKHAEATEIRVALDFEAEGVSLSVSNNGAPLRPLEPGFGLRNMEQRVASVGGELDVVAEPSGSFSVRARVELKALSRPATLERTRNERPPSRPYTPPQEHRVDVAFATAMVGLLASAGALVWYNADEPRSGAVVGVAVLLGMMVALLAGSALRGRWGLESVSLLAVLSGWVIVLSEGHAFVASVVPVAVAALHLRRRPRLVLVGALTLTYVVVEVAHDPFMDAMLWCVFFVGITAFVGLTAGLVARLRDNLALRVRLATSDERARVVAELHESLGHSLLAAHRHAAAAEISIRHGEASARALLVAARTRSKGGLGDVRHAVRTLRSSDDIGLVQGLTTLVEVSNATRGRARLTVSGRERPVLRRQGLSLLRVAQGTLAHAWRQDPDSEVLLQLRFTSTGAAKLTVMAPCGSAPPAELHGEFHLWEQEVASLGGTLVTETKAADGFIVRVWVP